MFFFFPVSYIRVRLYCYLGVTVMYQSAIVSDQLLFEGGVFCAKITLGTDPPESVTSRRLQIEYTCVIYLATSIQQHFNVTSTGTRVQH